MNLQELALTWEEVECFVRPQLLLAHDIDAGLDVELLFLNALYRANGYGAYFQETPDGYFSFCDQVLQQQLPLTFEVERFDSSTQAAQLLCQQVAQEGVNLVPILVPANIRDIPYFEGYPTKDWAHYFIVDRYDAARGLFHVRDNLHLAMDSRATEYRPFVIEKDVLFAAMELFGQSHVEHGYLFNDAYYRFKQYWLMRLQAVPSGQQPHAGLAQRIIAHFIRCAGAAANGAGGETRNDEDVRCLEQGLRQARALDTRLLLMAANQRNLYVKLLLRALDDVYPGQQETIKKEVRRLFGEKSAMQMQALVRLHRRDIPDAQGQAQMMGKLTATIQAIDQALLTYVLQIV